MTRARLVQILRAAGQRFLREESGNASVEFVILFPITFVLFVVTGETGILLAHSTLLERALDMSVRPLRLGSAMDHAELKDSICQNLQMIPNCRKLLFLEMRPLSGSFEPLTTAPLCFDRATETAPDESFDLGAPDEIVILRACLVVDPISSSFRPLAMFLPKDPSGGIQLIALSAFVNEPGAGA